MKPRVIKIDPNLIDIEGIKEAAEVIKNRGLVAFPTETVYGLGANALDPKAVAKIFEAKKRPLDDPLIVHVSKIADLYDLVEEVSSDLERIVNRFWPGPLTVILKKKDIVSDIVTTGLETVAIRMPSSPIAKKLIELSGVPIAAPSANLFSRPSPTKAQHVIDDLDGRIDVVIDGGDTEIGIESTVIEVLPNKILVLRPGGIDVEKLQEMVQEVKVIPEHDNHITPGSYPQHYSPKAHLIVVPDSYRQVEEVKSISEELVSKGQKFGLMIKQEHEEVYGNIKIKVLGPEKDLRVCASRLFSVLREFDSENVDTIIAEGVKEKGLGVAIMNRLRKAAGPAV
jgi:L-threonylcarbamoyladenylate synthase